MRRTERIFPRSAYWKKNGLLAALEQTPYLSQTFKLYEDIVLYDKISTWPGIGAYFGDVLDEEQAFAVSLEDIHTWHRAMRAYITTKPSINDAVSFIAALRIAPNTVEAIGQLLQQLSKRPELPETIEGMYENLREALQQEVQDQP